MNIEYRKELNQEVRDLMMTLAELPNLLDKIEDATSRIWDCFESGGKLLIAGNGGSAAEAQHFSAELISRYVVERNPLPGIALSTDTSTLTAIANDYGQQYMFSKQIEALGNHKDILFLMTTSGNSDNILHAIQKALGKGMHVIVLTGKDGGRVADWQRNYCMGITEIRVPSNSTARIQEVHLLIVHMICYGLDKLITEGKL
jgi:DnaA initiator-associating protein